MMQSPTALGVGVTARVTVRAVPLGTVSVVRARVPALGPSGCRRWGRWSWGRRGRPTGLDGGGLLLGLPVGIGRLGGFRGLIPFGLLGTLRLLALTDSSGAFPLLHLHGARAHRCVANELQIS